MRVRSDDGADLSFHGLDVYSMWESLDAEQNSFVLRTAAHHDLALLRGEAESWNVRDEHMANTLDRLAEHHGPDSRVVVWAHNTHVGDARFTSMGTAGMRSLGQLVRDRHEADGVVLVGFASYTGTVMAARHWGRTMREMRLPPAMEGSWEDVLHDVLGSDSLLAFTGTGGDLYARGHRAIGVVYRPEREIGTYLPTVLPRRYDALLYLDETRALHPLYGLGPSTEDGVERTLPPGP
jgi:erythromycin esterase-like protein